MRDYRECQGMAIVIEGDDWSLFFFEHSASGMSMLYSTL